ncbi:MAG: hypothetical protein AAF206_25160, partial [Bacteroidota bacterium]
WGKFQNPQAEANQWWTHWEKHWQQHEVLMHQIPMMSEFYVQSQAMIEAGMRKGIPMDRHHRFSCYYGNQAEYKKLLGVRNPNQAQLFLLDETGMILHTEQGPPQPEGLQTINRLLFES